MKVEKSLREGSKSYHSEANIYEEFTKAQDFPKNIFSFLKSQVKEKIVFDLGCGNGKYASLLAPFSKEYIGLDISSDQINIAKKSTKNIKNTKFIISSAEKINLPKNSIDIIISTWVISAMRKVARRAKALKEAERILKKSGRIYLIENDIGGEFEIIRRRYPNIKKTKAYHDWTKKKGFKVVKKINTYFRFNSLNQAREVIGSIWGEKVGNLVKSKIVKQKVIIFKKIKI